MDTRLPTLYSRALCLLAECSSYVPRHLQGEIELLADDSDKAGMPLRVEHRDGLLIINPLNRPE